MIQPKTIVRPDKHGAVDDVVITDVSTFRLERMDSGKWWLACYRGDKRICFWFNSKKRIDVTITEDDFGAEDDAEETAAQIAAMIAAHEATGEDHGIGGKIARKTHGGVGGI